MRLLSLKSSELAHQRESFPPKTSFTPSPLRSYTVRIKAVVSGNPSTINVFKTVKDIVSPGTLIFSMLRNVDAPSLDLVSGYEYGPNSGGPTPFTVSYSRFPSNHISPKYPLVGSVKRWILG